MSAPATRQSAPAAPTIPFYVAFEHPRIFGPWFSGPSWDAWKAINRAVDAGPMTPAQREIFAKVAGGRALPARPVREEWDVIGRRGAKSLRSAARALHAATMCDYRQYLAPGERAVVMVVSGDRDQSQVIFKYVEGLLDAIPMLAAMVAPGGRTKESIEFLNRTIIKIQTCNFRRVRGQTVAYAAFDEAATWMSNEDSRNPDREVLAAVRPAMLTIPTSRLVVTTSPYAQKGIVWDAHHRYFGKDDPGVIVFQAPTEVMNPLVDRAFIAEEYAKDEASARAEYGACFRTDVADWISPEVVEACVVAGRTMLPFEPHRQHYAYLDPAGGTGSDSAALAISRTDGDAAVICRIVEWKPFFDPAARVAPEIAEVLREYGLRSLVSDRYSGGTWASLLRAHGVAVEFSELTTSDVYHDALPILTSRRVQLLDHRRANGQLLALERTTSRLGKDTISHPPNAHDDLAAVICGAALRAAVRRPRMFASLAAEHMRSQRTAPAVDPDAARREEAELRERIAREQGQYVCPDGHRFTSSLPNLGAELDAATARSDQLQSPQSRPGRQL